MHITVSDDNNYFLIIPIVPNDNVKISGNFQNEEFETINGYLRPAGPEQLRSLSWNSFFPVNKDYNFVEYLSEPDGWVYVAFFNLFKGKPIRAVVTAENFQPLLNMRCLIKAFSYTEEPNGDISYSITLEESPEKPKRIL